MGRKAPNPGRDMILPAGWERNVTDTEGMSYSAARLHHTPLSALPRAYTPRTQAEQVKAMNRDKNKGRI